MALPLAPQSASRLRRIWRISLSRPILVIVALVVLGLVAGWAYFKSRSWEVDDATLMSRYGEGSEMIELDGARFRYKDTGNGPAIILLHGAFANLNYWDDWASELEGNHRVIRFDVPPEGIGDPDPKGYSHDRVAELVGLLADELDVEKFALSGLSRGGTAATLYAGRNPDRVTHLILTNTPLLNTPPDAVKLSPAYARGGWIAENLLSSYRPMFFWNAFFEFNTHDSSRIGEDRRRLFMDMNNREGATEDLVAMRSMGADRPEERNITAASAVTAPTLFITTHSRSLPLVEQERVIRLFDHLPAETIAVDTGHFPAMETGMETAAIVARFMSENPPAAPADDPPES